MTRGRPATPPGQWGSINHTKTTNGKWQALTRLRLYNGHTVRIKATDHTKTGATTALITKCQQRLELTGHTAPLAPNSTIAALLKTWIDQHPVSDNSKRIYGQAMRGYINPAIGALRINELDTPTVHALLQGQTVATAKTIRAVLSSAYKYAHQIGITTNDPVRHAAGPKSTHKKVGIPTDKQLAAFRKRIAKYCESGRAESLLEIIDTLQGTGLRIGECLALHWEDVDLNNGQIHVHATIDAKGRRQDHPKTASGNRIITAQTTALKALRRQAVKDWISRVRQLGCQIVFPTSAGTYRREVNVNRTLRTIKESMPKELSSITPHTYRRVMGTKLEHRYGLLAASRYLGHSNSTITEAHYVATPEVIALPLN